jgi:hypothetical protein
MYKRKITKSTRSTKSIVKPKYSRHVTSPQKKIFVIGFNKTGTITLHRLFLNNGLKSEHNGRMWHISKFNCFSDNGNERPFKNYAERFPNSIFILNTRQLDRWIISRCKHCIFYKHNWFYPFTTELFINTIDKRQKHFLDVMNFFRKQPNRLILVDISKPNWINFICQKLGIKFFDIHAHNKPDDTVDQDKLQDAYTVLDKAFTQLNIKNDDRGCNFILESLLNPEEKELYKQLVRIYKMKERSNFL